MKTLQLTVDDKLYDTLLAMLKGLPKKRIVIIENPAGVKFENKPIDLNKFAGKIKSFSAIKDPVAWQREIRSEWDRDWDK